jgi:hypothetical protein
VYQEFIKEFINIRGQDPVIPGKYGEKDSKKYGKKDPRNIRKRRIFRNQGSRTPAY